MKLFTPALLCASGLIFPWTEMNPSQNPPIRAGISGWERVVYASAINSAVVLALYEMPSSEFQNGLLAYSLRDNRWDILDVAGGAAAKSDYLTAGGHDFLTSCYDDNLHAVVTPKAWAMTLGHNGMCQYDVRGNIGRLYYTAPAGGLNDNVATCFDPDSGCVYYLGGAPGGGSSGSSTFVRYRTATNEWKTLANCPVATTDLTIAYDRALRRVLIPRGYAYNPATNSWQSASTPSGDLVYNELMQKTEGLSFSTYGPHTRAVAGFSPFDNQYVAVDGSYGYRSRVFTESSSASGTRPLPAYQKETYSADGRWKSLGGAVSNHALGFAQEPAIVSHNGSLHLAWGEFDPPDWTLNAENEDVFLSRWNGSAWQKVAGLGRGHYDNFPELLSNGNDLYLGTDNFTVWSGTTALCYRLNGSTLDTLGRGPRKNAKPDSSQLPQLVWYQDKLHALYIVYRTWSEFGGMGHAYWDAAARKWMVVDSNVVIWPGPNAPAGPRALENNFSAVAVNDGIVAAYTMKLSSLPLAVDVKKYNGSTWSTLPAISVNRSTYTTTCPSLAASPATGGLCIAYLRRAAAGRKNNELIVEKFTGSGWQSLGNPLNVNDNTKDAWAFRPSLAFNSTGVLYVAWTEHVWGSSSQVYTAHWNGSQWVRDFAPGTSLNTDGTNGSAQSVSLAFDNDKPTVAWSEHTFGGGRFRKIYVKQLDEVISATEVAPGKAAARISISPNPVTGGRAIFKGIAGGSFGRAAVYDAGGRRVEAVRDGILNTAGWPAGVYMLKIENNDGVFTKRFLVQN